MSFLLTRRMIRFCAAAMVGCLAAYGATAQAALLWYDGFTTTDAGGQYDTAIPLGAAGPVGGQNGGAGTFFITNPAALPTGNYIQQGGAAHSVVTTSLTVPNQLQPSTGGSVTDPDTGRTGRRMAQPWQGLPAQVPQGTFYIGFLANFGSGPSPQHRVFEMWSGSDETLPDSNRELQLGYSEFTGMGTTLSLQLDGGTTPLSENLQFANDGATHNIVLRFDLSNTLDSDRVRVYLDAVGTVEPAVASADVSGINFTASYVGTIVNFIFNGPVVGPTFDELRVATTYEEVAMRGVPEPGTGVMLAAGAMALAAARRRR
jgi:hypothetical protein